MSAAISATLLFIRVSCRSLVIDFKGERSEIWLLALLPLRSRVVKSARDANGEMSDMRLNLRFSSVSDTIDRIGDRSAILLPMRISVFRPWKLEMADASLIWLLLRSRYVNLVKDFREATLLIWLDGKERVVRSVREASGDRSVIWLLANHRPLRLGILSMPVTSEMFVPSAKMVLGKIVCPIFAFRSAKSDGYIRPVGLLIACLIAASRLESGNLISVSAGAVDGKLWLDEASRAHPREKRDAESRIEKKNNTSRIDIASSYGSGLARQFYRAGPVRVSPHDTFIGDVFM